MVWFMEIFIVPLVVGFRTFVHQTLFFRVTSPFQTKSIFDGIGVSFFFFAAMTETSKNNPSSSRVYLITKPNYSNRSAWIR